MEKCDGIIEDYLHSQSQEEDLPASSAKSAREINDRVKWQGL